MRPKRILLPTDLPFWRRRDGAEQRISELVRFLVEAGGDLHVFFLGTLSAQDKLAVERLGLEVIVASSDEPPADWLPRMRWYLAASLNQLRRQRQPGDRQADRPMVLGDFAWSWSKQKFAEAFRRVQPDFLIVEYIKLAYLLDGLSASERRSAKCLVDTHDVLHLRCAEFEERGFRHWIRISRAEEAECISRFDFAMAIQANEAEVFRELAPATRTIVVRHSVESYLGEGKSRDSFVGGPFPTVGYLASSNFSNASAIRKFLRQVWPKFLERQPSARLLIAGSICDGLATEDGLVGPPRNVDLLGYVERLGDFYSAVDLVINPVEFGTGLKIKNCEPLAFGLPVVTTAKGLAGMELPPNQAVLVADDLSLMVQKMLEIATDLPGYGPRCEQAVQLARTEFSDEKAYSELRRVLFDL